MVWHSTVGYMQNFAIKAWVPLNKIIIFLNLNMLLCLFNSKYRIRTICANVDTNASGLISLYVVYSILIQMCTKSNDAERKIIPTKLDRSSVGSREL